MHYIEDDLRLIEVDLQRVLLAEIGRYLASWDELRRLYGP